MNEDLTGLTLIELLDLLEPVPEPPPVSLWPQTAGWIVLGLVIAAGVAWLVHRRHSAWRSNAYRREALREIAAAGNDPVALAAILRRTALAAYPRDRVAGLHGPAWLEFLDGTGDTTAFTDGPGKAIAIAPYAPRETEPDIAAPVAAWVRRHRQHSGRSG